MVPNQPSTLRLPGCQSQLPHAARAVECARHKLALDPITPKQHHLARNRKLLTLRQTYFVVKVATSGQTLEAALLALGFGAGLIFADAHDSTTFVFALSLMFKGGGVATTGVRNAFRTDSAMLSEPL